MRFSIDADDDYCQPTNLQNASKHCKINIYFPTGRRGLSVKIYYNFTFMERIMYQHIFLCCYYFSQTIQTIHTVYPVHPFNIHQPTNLLYSLWAWQWVSLITLIYELCLVFFFRFFSFYMRFFYLIFCFYTFKSMFLCMMREKFYFHAYECRC